MRKIARTDSNHAAVTKALRQIGASVTSLHRVGEGVPDLIAGYHGMNLLLEVKDGAKPPSARELTADEREWHANWAGRAVVVTSGEEAQREIIRYVQEHGGLR